MEEADALIMAGNTSKGAKGMSLGVLRHKTFSPRKRLSDISNLSNNGIGNGLIFDNHKNVKNGSPVTVNEYIAKLLMENNAVMKALAERNAEMQILRLKVTKISQQNWQLAQANSQMLAELNSSKDRLKVAHHELGCSSAVLKVKNMEMEELKKLNKKNKGTQNVTNPKTTKVQVENALDASQLPSHKKTCLPNRKRPKRSQSLGPMPITDQTTIEQTEENRRKSVRRSINMNAKSCVPSGDLFEIDEAKFPLCSPEKRELKDETNSIKQEPSSPAIQIKEEQRDQFSYSSGRNSLGRPLRRAAVKVNSYKEMSLLAKLRRPE